MYPNTKLDSVLKEIVARWGIPGMGIGIIECGEITYARGFGVQSLETKAPVTPDSIFCLASIAKCFVASSVICVKKFHPAIDVLELKKPFSWRPKV
jgi:CubicO group peptidase (beta-lactamase class C family)